MVNDNISTPPADNPSEISGIAHVAGDTTFNQYSPKGSTIERIDYGFKETLKSIGFMRRVVDRIEKRQETTIESLKEVLEKGQVIKDKVDDVQEILEKMMGSQKRKEEQDEKQRREELLESRTPQLVSGKEGINNPTTLNNTTIAAIIGGGLILSQIYKAGPEIMGALQSLRGMAAAISGGASATASALGSASATIKSTSQALMSTSSAISSLPIVSAAAAARMSNFVRWMNWFRRITFGVVVLDSVATLWYGYSKEGDEPKLMRSVAVVFGRIAGAYGGAFIMGKLLGLLGGALGTLAGGPIGGVLAFIASALAGFVAGYYGYQFGEMVGLALYKFFSSDLKDMTGAFKQVYDYIVRNMTLAGDFVVKQAKSVMQDIGEFVGLGGSGNNSSGGGGESDDRAPKPSGTKPSVGSSVTTAPPSGGGGSGGGGSGGGGSGGGSSRRIGGNEVSDAIQYVADNSGGDLALVQAIVDIESSGNPTAGYYNEDGTLKSEKKGYKGLFQTRRTRHSPMDGAKDTVKKITDNKAHFRSHHGRDPSVAEIYLMHQQGIAGGCAFMLAYYKEPNILAWQGLSKYMSVKGHRPMSAKEAQENLIGNMWGPLKKFHYMTITVKQFVDTFVKDFLRRYENFKKMNSSGSSETKTVSGAPVTAGMTPVGYSPSGGDPSYGEGGEDVAQGGMTFDKSNDQNHPALDAITDILVKEGFITKGSRMSFDDDHHHKYNKGGLHDQGLALDISVPGQNAAGRQKMINRILALGKELGIKIHAEDHTGKGGSTGQHIHVYFTSKADADKFMTAWRSKYGKNKTPSNSSPEILSNAPNSGSQLLAFADQPQSPKVIQITQPVIMQGGSDGGNRGGKNGGLSGTPPASYNPSNREILSNYV